MCVRYGKNLSVQNIPPGALITRTMYNVQYIYCTMYILNYKKTTAL
jgi:hypothetical protein